MNAIVQELKIIRRGIVYFMLTFLLVTVFLLLFALKPWSFHDHTILIPYPGTPSIATQLFHSAQRFLVPENVAVVALGPTSVFFAPLIMALLVGLLLVFPYGIYLISRFLSPALRPGERKAFIATVVPALPLFYLGSALAYFVIIPETFRILYSFAEPLGVAPLFALDTFLSSVFLITISVGVSFLFPIVMALLSIYNFVPAYFWIKHWRGAFLTILIFSAVITPDGSGFTMVFLSVPLVLLYGLGSLAAHLRRKSPSVLNQDNQ